MAFRKIKAGLVNADVNQFVGETGNLFFDITTGALRLSDGVTPGGTLISTGGGSGSYTLPTASTTTKGGVKVDGTTLNVSSEILSVGTVPYAKISNAPAAVSAFTNDSGYITSSALTGYATQAYVTGRGYITSAALPTAVSQLSNDSGYLTDADFDLSTIDYDTNNKLHVTGILPGDADGFTAIYAGQAAGAAVLPNTVIQSQAEINDYAQNNFQNAYDGTKATTEWVATSPSGDNSNYYIDMGITGAQWDGTADLSLYTNVGQRDGFIYVQGGSAGGGNFTIGTTIANTYTKIVAGNAQAGDKEVIRFSEAEVKLSKPLKFSDNSTQTTAWLGTLSYNSLTDKPTLVTSYNSLTDLPTLVTSYNDLTDLPTLFSGAYADLSGKPTLFSGAYADLSGKPTLFSGSYNDLTDKPAAGASSLGQLTDVDLTTPPTIGQVLKYDGTKWSPGTDITSGGAGTDADTLDGFDSSYYLNYNNLTNTPTIPTTVTVNGTSIALDGSGTITANTTNALTVGYGLTGTASTFNGSAANTVKLDTSTTTIAATAGATLTLAAATLTRNYVITGSLASSYTIKLPDITTLNVGQQIRFYLTSAPISIRLSDNTLIYNHSSRGSNTTTITYTVLSIAANLSTNLYVETSTTGLSGTGTSLVSNIGPTISTAYITNLDSVSSTNAYASTPTLTVGPTSGAFTHALNLYTAATSSGYSKTINIGTGGVGGSTTINIGSNIGFNTIRGNTTFTHPVSINDITIQDGTISTTVTNANIELDPNGTGTVIIQSDTTINGALTVTSGITGNASTATRLSTARTINGVSFDGSGNIDITATATAALTIGTGLSGTSYNGSTGVTIAVDSTVALRADTTYIGTTAIALNRTSATQSLTGVSIDGNAATVTNGVYTTGTYANPAWITSLAYSKLTGTPTIFSGSYTDLTNKPTIPTNVSELANDSGYITAAAIPAQFTFNVAADDSSMKTISSEETIKFIGSTGIDTTSDAEGAITIAIDSTVATLTGAQTLTNKTISGSSNTITNIANSSLTNSSITIGNTAISLGSSSSTLGGVAWITFAGSTSGTTQLRPSAIAGTTTVTMPGTTGTLITTGDSGTVTNTMLAGSIANSKLANSSVTVNGTSISLGSSATITVNSISASGFTGVLGFDAAGSLILSNTNKFRSPSGLTIETGTSPLKDWTFSTTGTLTFPDSTVQSTAYTGNADTVTNGVYTTDTGTVTNTMLAGSIANAKLANSSVTINGTSVSLGSSATVTAAAGTLTGTTLNSTVVTSSLTSVGTLTSLTSSGTITSSKAGDVTHGTGAQLYINGSTYSRIDFSDVYADPVVNDRSTGTRLLFNPGTRAGGMDCAIGMSSTTLWSSVQDPNFNFGWYAGDGLGVGSPNLPITLLTLSGAGVLTVPGGASVTSNSATNKNLSIGTHGQLFDDGNLHLHTSGSTLWINSLDSGDIKIGTQYNSGSGSDVYAGKNIYANSGSVTANATTAFIAGANAVSNVSLQMPSESALRNLTNGFTNMYFDVSIGGTTHGAFKFRSSSSYTDVLTMSPTVFSVNTGATVTARTPALARTAFNAAIDTEITVDNMRFRISNQGGIFPQVIGNGSSRNLAWTGVGAISGSAVTQVGSTGTIVADNAWTTLYNAHGMDSAGDTVTVTLQDKAGSAIYRITFMRSDNGSTTGYNIIGERIL